MSPAAVWVAFALAGLVTVGQRSLFFWLDDGLSQRLLPDRVRRALRYVAPAAFAAIAFPRVVVADGTEIGLPSPVEMVFDARFLAAVVASLVMWRTGRMPLMLVVGMMVFWALHALGL